MDTTTRGYLLRSTHPTADLGHTPVLFTRGSFPAPKLNSMKKSMDDTETLPAGPAADWTHLRPGQSVTVAENGYPACTGTIDAVAPDASVLWVRITGIAPRRMFLHTDPVDIRSAH